MGDRARELRDRGRRLHELPVLTRMGETMKLGEAVSEFLVQLADKVDELTPDQGAELEGEDREETADE